MDTLLVLVFCAAVALGITLVFFSVLAIGTSKRRQCNRRGHRLGRFLAVSHPHWTGEPPSA